MPKEVNLTGDEVVALTQNIYQKKMLLLSIRPWFTPLNAIVVNIVNQVNLISFTLSKWQVF